MSSGEPQLEPDRSQNDNPGDSAPRSISGLNSWRHNWMPLVVITVPLLVGAICVGIFVQWLPHEGEFLAAWGIVFRFRHSFFGQ